MYIPGPRNKMADGLSRTIFRTENCDYEEPHIQEALRLIRSEGAQWIWKDGGGGYEEFLGGLNSYEKEEVVGSGQLHGVNVFTSEVIESPELSWADAYQESELFGKTYRILLGTERAQPKEFQKAFKFRLDPHTSHLLIHQREEDIYLPCIPEAKVRSILE